jgi:hypothetical protein
MSDGRIVVRVVRSNARGRDDAEDDGETKGKKN